MIRRRAGTPRFDLDALIARTRPRRGRGSRAEAQAVSRTHVPTEEEVSDLVEALEKRQGHHGRSGPQRSRGGDWYQFYIKGWRSPPAEVTAALGEAWVEEVIQERAAEEMEWLLSDVLQEAHSWLGGESWTAGRSGGWWLLEDASGTLSSLREYTHVNRPFKRITGRHVPDPETSREMAKVYASAKAFLRELDTVDARVRQAVKDFWTGIQDPESWEDELRAARQRAGEQDEDAGSENRRGRRRGR